MASAYVTVCAGFQKSYKGQACRNPIQYSDMSVLTNDALRVPEYCLYLLRTDKREGCAVCPMKK